MKYLCDMCGNFFVSIYQLTQHSFRMHDIPLQIAQDFNIAAKALGYSNIEIPREVECEVNYTVQNYESINLFSTTSKFLC